MSIGRRRHVCTSALWVWVSGFRGRDADWAAASVLSENYMRLVQVLRQKERVGAR